MDTTTLLNTIHSGNKVGESTASHLYQALDRNVSLFHVINNPKGQCEDDDP